MTKACAASMSSSEGLGAASSSVPRPQSRQNSGTMPAQRTTKSRDSVV